MSLNRARRSFSSSSGRGQTPERELLHHIGQGAPARTISRVVTPTSPFTRPTPEQARAVQVRSAAVGLVAREAVSGSQTFTWSNLASVSSTTTIRVLMDPDAMDIDSPPPESLAQIASQGKTTSCGMSEGGPIFRHTFEIDIRSPLPGSMSNIEAIRSVRTRIRMGQPVQSQFSAGNRSLPQQRRSVVRIMIDTLSQSREDALVLVDTRLGYMVAMSEDGLGWFPGLPWSHDHFQVRMKIF